MDTGPAAAAGSQVRHGTYTDVWQSAVGAQPWAPLGTRLMASHKHAVADLHNA